jgi:hypothetical protein
LSRRRPIFAPFNDHRNAIEVDVGPSKESHESGSTDESTEELEHVNEYHKVFYSDLTDDEFFRSLFKDQNDIHADRRSRDMSYLIDNPSRDFTKDLLAGSEEREAADKSRYLPNAQASNEGTIYDSEEIPDMVYEGILLEFNH